MNTDCDCPPRWDRDQLIPCDHEKERLELWFARYDDWWWNE